MVAQGGLRWFRRILKFHVGYFFFFFMVENQAESKQERKALPSPLLLISFSVAQCIKASHFFFPHSNTASGHDLDGKFK